MVQTGAQYLAFQRRLHIRRPWNRARRRRKSRVKIGGGENRALDLRTITISIAPPSKRASRCETRNRTRWKKCRVPSARNATLRKRRSRVCKNKLATFMTTHQWGVGTRSANWACKAPRDVVLLGLRTTEQASCQSAVTRQRNVKGKTL